MKKKRRSAGITILMAIIFAFAMMMQTESPACATDDPIGGGLKPDEIRIDPADLTGLKYGMPEVTLSLSEGGQGTGEVSWQSSDEEVLYISGNKAYIIKPGTVTVTAKKASDGVYHETRDSIEVSIAKGEIEITWPTVPEMVQGAYLREYVFTDGSRELGSFSWKNPDRQLDAAGKIEEVIVFTPNEDTAAFYDVAGETEKTVEITVRERTALDNIRLNYSDNPLDFGTDGSTRRLMWNNFSGSDVNFTYQTPQYFVILVPEQLGASGSTVYNRKPLIFFINPKQTLPPGNYEEEIVFTFGDPNSGNTVEKSFVARFTSTGEGPVDSISASPSPVDFGKTTAGDSRPAEQTVTLSASTSDFFHVYRASSSCYDIGYYYYNGMYTTHAVIGFSYDATFTIRPKEGLPAGTYDEELRIRCETSQGEEFYKTISLKYTVEPRSPSITVTGDGNGNPSADQSNASIGSVVTVSADPKNGYVFDEWQVISGGIRLADETAPVTTFVMGEEDVELKATYKPIPAGSHRVTAAVGTGKGSAAANPGYYGGAGGTIGLKATPAEGYYFDKWTEESSAAVEPAFDDNSKPETSLGIPGGSSGEIRVYAHFVKNPYDLTVAAEGAGSAKASASSGRKGDVAALTAEPREHFRFKRWTLTSGAGTIEDASSPSTEFTFGEGNAAVKAVFEKIDYKLTVEVKNPGRGTVDVESTEGALGYGTFQLTARPEEGCVFEKYQLEDPNAPVTVLYTSGETIMWVQCHSAETPLSAYFNTVPYDISYDPKGGTNNAENPATYTVEDEITLAAPKKEGYTFDGWYDGSGNKVTKIAKGTTGNLALEAHWTLTVYDIEYVLNGGTNHPDNPDTYTFETKTIELQDPTYEKYVFDGWYDAGGNRVTQISEGSTGNRLLTARWKKAPAPNIEYPSASDLTYGQSLADSSFTGGSTEYGDFAWAYGSTVPNAGTNAYGAVFTPSEDTVKYYEALADEAKAGMVNVNVSPATPAVTVAAGKTGQDSAALTAAVEKVGLGTAPTGNVSFRYSTDGENWTEAGTASLQEDEDGNNQAFLDWNFPEEEMVYQICAVYDGTDGNYNEATSLPIDFDPRKLVQEPLTLRASNASPTYGDALAFDADGGTGTGKMTYSSSDPGIVKVDKDTGAATIIKAGTVTITAVKERDTHYNQASAALSLTVKKAKMTFTADSKSVKQGAPMPALTYRTGGLIKGDSVAKGPLVKAVNADGKTRLTNTKKAGRFTIVISGGAVRTKAGAPWTDCYIPEYKGSKLRITAVQARAGGVLLATAKAKGRTAMKISWTKVSGAAGYDIFFAACNHDGKTFKCKKVRTVKGNKTFTWTKKGLRKHGAYKAYVKAYVMKNGKKSYIGTSPMAHAYATGYTKRYTNAKSVTVNKTSVSLKKGKTFKIKASVNKVNKNKKLTPKSHAATLRYMTSNSKIATVNSSGKITAKGKGTCYIYAYAHNGVSKQIKVTVK